MSEERKQRGENRKNTPLLSVLLLLWCEVIFSYDEEKHTAIKTIISAAALPSLTVTSLSQQRNATHTH